MKKLIGPERLSIAEVFHENTKLFSYEVEKRAGRMHGPKDYVKNLLDNQNMHDVIEMTRAVSTGRDTFEKMKTFSIPNKLNSRTRVLVKTITSRRTIREYSGDSLKTDELAAILQSYSSHSYKTDGLCNKNIPSAGSLYPLQIYITLPSKIGHKIPKGIFYFNPDKYCLKLINLKPNIKEIVRFVAQPEVDIQKSSAILFITSVFKRAHWKYGERAYRYALIEAGHLAQNMLLLSESMNLAACPIGGFIDDRANNYLKIDGLNEFVVYIIVVGKTQKEGN